MEILNPAEKSHSSIAKMDENKIKLISFLNRLYEAMLNSSWHEVISKLLNGPVNYTTNHSSAEEQLMLVIGYHNYQSYKVQHSQLINKANELKMKYKEGQDNLGVDLTDFLKIQLIGHLLSSDFSSISYMKEKGYIK